MDPRFSSLTHQSAAQDCTESSGYIPSGPGGRLPDVLREDSLGFKGLDEGGAEVSVERGTSGWGSPASAPSNTSSSPGAEHGPGQVDVVE